MANESPVGRKPPVWKRLQAIATALPDHPELAVWNRLREDEPLNFQMRLAYADWLQDRGDRYAGLADGLRVLARYKRSPWRCAVVSDRTRENPDPHRYIWSNFLTRFADCEGREDRSVLTTGWVYLLGGKRNFRTRSTISHEVPILIPGTGPGIIEHTVTSSEWHSVYQAEDNAAAGWTLLNNAERSKFVLIMAEAGVIP